MFDHLTDLRTKAARVPRDVRTLTALTLIEALGKGIFLSGNVVFFSLYVGLSPQEIGWGMSAAGISGFAASVLIGPVADRWGARRVLSALFAMSALCFASYPWVHSAAAFYVVVVVLGFLEWGTGPVKAAILAEVVGGGDRVRASAGMRTVFNIGFSLGSVVATVAIAGRAALLVIPIVTATAMLVATLLVRRLPTDVRTENVGAPVARFSAVRDRRFMAVVAICAVQATHVTVLMVALPLWLLAKTDAPPSLIPLALVLNTALVITLQVRASRGAETVLGAAHLAGRSAWWLAAACAAIAATSVYRAPVPSALLLGLAVILLTVAELMQSAAGWGLAFGLAPDSMRGEYLGTFQLHLAAQTVLGPVILCGPVVAAGGAGWLVVALVVLVSAALIVPAARAASSQGCSGPLSQATPL